MLQAKKLIKREHHAVITSTQDRAKEIASHLTSLEWHVVTADTQTKGRGTHGRMWLSPPNVNLYATFVFPVSSDKTGLIINIPQVIAYSVFETLKQCGLHPQLKWINDILINKKKVSGILCETEKSVALDNHYVVLAGIGINVNMDQEACASLDLPATSLMLELGHQLDKEEILTKLTNNVTSNIQKLIQYGFACFVPEISANLAFLGEKIKVQLDDAEKTVKEGMFVGINAQGMLLLQHGNKIETLFLGRIMWHSQTEVSKKSVAIIGAGPSGLVSAKYARDYGLNPIVLEQNEDIGGVWQPDTGMVWESMRTNLSYFSCMFTDLPWESPTDDFPSQDKMYEYLCKYADKFSLRDSIKFKCQVVELKEKGNQWEITWNTGGEQLTQLFDHVVIACGIFSEEHIPKFPGLDSFTGTKIHSKNYKSSKQFKDKTVAVIGSSFSGIEIASDLTANAKKVNHIFRTAQWILPRNIPLNPKDPLSPKWPLDLLFYNRATRAQTEEIKFKTFTDNEKSNAYMDSICHAQGEVSADLLVPKEVWNQPSRVAISDTYVSQIKENRITTRKADIASFDSSGIVLGSGEKIALDAIIFCTGYKLKIPFFTPEMQEKLEFSSTDQLQPLILYKCTFRPEFRHLAFVGVYRGPYFAVMELQAKWAMSVFANKVDFPSEESFRVALEEERRIRQLSPRPPFPHGDYVGLADSIAKEVKCLPDFEQLKSTNPTLYELIYKSPVVPADYCFTQDGILRPEAQSLEFHKQLVGVKKFLDNRNASVSRSSNQEPIIENSRNNLFWGFNYKYAAGVALAATGIGLYLYARNKKS